RVDIKTVVVIPEHDVLDVPVCGVGGKIGREQHGIGAHDLAVHGCAAVYGTGIIIERTAEPHRQLRRLGQVDVDIGAQAVALEVDVVVEIVAVIHFHQPVVLVVGAGNIIAGYTAPAADAQ